MKKIAIYTIALISTGFVACKNDEVKEPTENNQETIISLSGSILQTRATTEIQSAALSLNNKVGAFGVPTEGTLGNHNNNQYSVGQNGTLVAVGSEMSAKKVSTVSIYAYAPYNATWALGSNTFTVASDQSTEAGYLASDLLHAKSENVNAANTVALGFAHKLSQLVVKFNNSDDLDISGATVSVMNTLPSATLNTQTGELGAASGTAVEITGAKNVNSNDTYVVIVPQTVASGTSFIKVSGVGEKNLIATLGADQVFEGGKKYTMTVTLGEAGGELTIGSITLSDWTDGGSFGATATPEEESGDNTGGNTGDDNGDDNGDDTKFVINLPSSIETQGSSIWTKDEATNSAIFTWWAFSNDGLIDLYEGIVDPKYKTLWFTLSELDLKTSSGLRIVDFENGAKCQVYRSSDNEAIAPLPGNQLITEAGTYYLVVKPVWTLDPEEKEVKANTKIRFGAGSTSLTKENAASVKVSDLYFSTLNPLAN